MGRSGKCMFSEWTLVSASIPSGNYLQTRCLSYADHSKFWGAGVGLFPGVGEGEDATLFAVFLDPKIFAT